jgi:hypothetical protein
MLVLAYNAGIVQELTHFLSQSAAAIVLATDSDD